MPSLCLESIPRSPGRFICCNRTDSKPPRCGHYVFLWDRIRIELLFGNRRFHGAWNSNSLPLIVFSIVENAEEKQSAPRGARAERRGWEKKIYHTRLVKTEPSSHSVRSSGGRIGETRRSHNIATEYVDETGFRRFLPMYPDHERGRIGKPDSQRHS
jgi:hypothetical protein